MVDVTFYRSFEDIYRGSRELIKSRLAIYLPFVLPLYQLDKTCPGVDLGCGRGEWLELMKENGVDALQGIDLDNGMLEASRERGLNVMHGDAIQSLQSLVSESQLLVTAFHLAEHLTFEQLQILIQESLRVLKPGGLLILETPNPENIVVGSSNFYLDPTHIRPIPSQLLSFMVQYLGFEKVKILRLQETNSLINSTGLTLLNVLNGVSPDYAVVAQKSGGANIVALISQAFEVEYGLDLQTLANNYDQQIKVTAQQAEVKAQQAEVKAQQAEVKAQQAEVKAQQLVEQVQRIETELNTIYHSTFGLIIAPLRVLRSTKKLLLFLPKTANALIQKQIQHLLAYSKLYVNRYPRLRLIILAIFSRFPALKACLKHATESRHFQPSVESALVNLTPYARSINGNLKSAIENRRKVHS